MSAAGRMIETFNDLLVILKQYGVDFDEEKLTFNIASTNETYILAPDQIPILIDRTIEQCKNLIKSLGQKKT